MWDGGRWGWRGEYGIYGYVVRVGFEGGWGGEGKGEGSKKLTGVNRGAESRDTRRAYVFDRRYAGW